MRTRVSDVHWFWGVLSLFVLAMFGGCGDGETKVYYIYVPVGSDGGVSDAHLAGRDVGHSGPHDASDNDGPVDQDAETGDDTGSHDGGDWGVDANEDSGTPDGGDADGLDSGLGDGGRDTGSHDGPEDAGDSGNDARWPDAADVGVGQDAAAQDGGEDDPCWKTYSLGDPCDGGWCFYATPDAADDTCIPSCTEVGKPCPQGGCSAIDVNKFVCMPVGTKKAKDPCTHPIDCEMGTVCLSSPDIGTWCFKVCSDKVDCATNDKCVDTGLGFNICYWF